jgi:hypothetical protein
VDVVITFQSTHLPLGVDFAFVFFLFPLIVLSGRDFRSSPSALPPLSHLFLVSLVFFAASLDSLTGGRLLNLALTCDITRTLGVVPTFVFSSCSRSRLLQPYDGLCDDYLTNSF